MAELRTLTGARSCVLQPEHLVGRSSQCALQLDASYVSAQHAVLRWQGRRWEVLDRGSRNGTRLDGVQLVPGRAYAVHTGAVLTFGHPDERWVLSSAGEPTVMVVALDTGEVLPDSLGVIGVPSGEDAACTLYLDVDGRWKLEASEADTRPVEDGDVFHAHGRSFRFCRPIPSSTTVAVPTDAAPTGVLHFSVSKDEEFVELRFENALGVTELGARSHNYLLLLLARAYLADAAAGIAPADCGWLDKEEIASSLKMTAPQVDGEVFRIRKHFAHHGLPESATVIERRPRTRQIRIGIPELRVEKR